MTAKNKTISERIELRPVISPEEEDFLQHLYGTTRDDIIHLPFDEAGKQAFILLQYAARKKHYDEYYAGAEDYIILYDRERAGRFTVEFSKDDIRLVDIAILPEYRGRGIGTALVDDTKKISAETARPFTLHAIKDSRALHLYERLGFRVIGETGIYNKLEWKPTGQESA